MNTYVYAGPNGYIMIDTGYEHSLSAVEKKLSDKEIGLSDIKYVFLTHAHDDHAGFLNELLGRNKDLKGRMQYISCMDILQIDGGVWQSGASVSCDRR